MKFSGKVWLFGDNIDTDVIAPGKYLQLRISDLAAHTLKVVREDFASGVEAGDVLLAGKNFGCGSSREQAPRALKELGLSVIVARSFARIFYRNCLAIGLPVATLQEPAEAIQDRDEVSVDLGAATLTHPASGSTFALAPTAPEVIALLEKGGIMPLIEEIGRSQAQ